MNSSATSFLVKNKNISCITELNSFIFIFSKCGNNFPFSVN